MAVVGSGLVGMLVYAGLFYSNARRTIPASSEMDSSLFQSREKAENAANEWISLGGISGGSVYDDSAYGTGDRTRKKEIKDSK